MVHPGCQRSGWWTTKGQESHGASPAPRTGALGVRKLPLVEGSHRLRLGSPSGLSRPAPPSQPALCSPHPEGTPTTELGCPTPHTPPRIPVKTDVALARLFPFMRFLPRGKSLRKKEHGFFPKSKENMSFYQP